MSNRPRKKIMALASECRIVHLHCLRWRQDGHHSAEALYDARLQRPLQESRLFSSIQSRNNGNNGNFETLMVEFAVICLHPKIQTIQQTTTKTKKQQQTHIQSDQHT